MSSKSRLMLFLLSTPLVLLAAVGGILGARAIAPQDFARHLGVFDDVTTLIDQAYVEPVNMDKVMDGAMRGLTDSLDPESAYLTPTEVRDWPTPVPPASVGLVITRQVYLRIVGVQDGSPAAKAGLRTGDYIRGIDGKSTRDMSMPAGSRLLHGTVGSKVMLTVFRGNIADTHDLDLVREAPATTLVTGNRLATGEAYVRVVSFAPGAAAALASELDKQRAAGATKAIIDVRGTADGPIEEGISAAKLFVKTGVLAIRAGRDAADRTSISAGNGDGAVTMPVVLLTNYGTANAAEVFAAALAGRERADLVGEPTAGLAAVQRLVPLSGGSALWLTYQRYLTPDGQLIDTRGVRPTVGVESPVVNFDEVPPATDAQLAAAVERLKKK